MVSPYFHTRSEHPVLTILAALACILVSGCAEVNTESPREKLQPMSFSSSVPEDSDGRTTIDGIDVKWSKGDEIGIYDGIAVRKFTLSSGAGTTSAVFKGEAADAESYIAVYPYSENLSVDLKGRITGLNVPRVQAAISNTVIMTAMCNGGDNRFAFKHALAYVKVTPRFDCSKIVLETYDSDEASFWLDLCGDIELDPYAQSVRVIGEQGNHVVLGGEIKAGGSYYFGVAPKYLGNGFKLIFDASDNGLQYTRKTDKDPVLFRGHVLDLGEFSKDGYWTERDADLPFSENDMWGEEGQGHFDYRSVYDWKDVTRIASHCCKIGSSRTVYIYFMGDIDFGGRELRPSILDAGGGVAYIFGNGHRITDYVQGTVDADGVRHAGLFYIKNFYSIFFMDLILCPKVFDVSSSGDICGGAFASRSHCDGYFSFKSCRVCGDISVKCSDNANAYAGGFVGETEITGVEDAFRAQLNVQVEDCLMEGSVTACSEDDIAYAGGFIGLVNAPEEDFECYISRSRNRAVVFAEGDDDSVNGFFGMDGVAAGGMIGCDRDDGGDVAIALNSCVNDGAVTAHAMDNDNTFAGGMVGCHDSDGSHGNPDKKLPYVNNCLNRGIVTATSGDSDDNAAGMIGYCYNDDTTFRNCVDDGELFGGKCAHISGTSGSYGSPCYWTKGKNHYGIYNKKDVVGNKPEVTVGELNAAGFDAKWITVDGHLDIDIIR